MTKELTIKEALNLAVKKHNQGKLGEAEILYRKILHKNPENPDALHLLGLIAYQTNRYEDAVKYIEKAIHLKSEAMYYGNLGMIYEKLNKEEKAAENFKKALELNPNYGNAHLAHYNLGIYHKNRGKIRKSLKHYDKAIELKKDFFQTRYNKAIMLLRLGKFKQGWKGLEYRFKKKSSVDSRTFKKPQLRNKKNIQDKKILIVSEQGFGDTIQFIRYLPLIKEKKCYIILECRKELKKLFQSLPVDEIVNKENIQNIDYDFYIHLMSLPRIFNTTLNTIPNNIPYLKPNTELIKKFEEKIKPKAKGKFKVGISWKGNPNQANDKNRSTELKNFENLKVPGVTLFSLQKSAEQLIDPEVVDLSTSINDFADTAAIIENLDLVISVDTALAHLAGALGKPVWTLLCFIPDWRYLLDRNDSPWYPTMRLFRQPKYRDWDSLFKKVKEELENIKDF